MKNTIEYLEFTKENINAIMDWGSPKKPMYIFESNKDCNEKSQARITTYDGPAIAYEDNDVIIKDSYGNLSICKKDIFEKTYNKIN